MGNPNSRITPLAILLVAMWLLACARLLAFDAVGTLKSVDPDKGVVDVFANGQDHVVPVAGDLKVSGTDGKVLAGGLASPDLKVGAEVTVTVERGENGPVIQAIRLGNGINTAFAGKPSVGFKPLTEMSVQDRYKGQDGGLYGGGVNEPPPPLLGAAKKQTQRIVPLDADGKQAKDGRIVLMSMSMSNATMEFSLFKQLADSDPAKSLSVTIVDCAQGGKAMSAWVDPTADAWMEADRRLARAGISPKQVQVLWVKLANPGPHGDLAEHCAKLQSDTMAALQDAAARFPNLRIAYLGSRIYGGYANTPLNPEPYAYEGAFAVRWLIQDQSKGDPDLRYDDTLGPVKAPLLLWGPYFWADGIVPRKSDGLVWLREDFGQDGTHPSQTGRKKVADMLLKFFKEDSLASSWFLNHPN